MGVYKQAELEGEALDGDELRRRRAALGLTREQLAPVLGVTLRTLARWELGEGPISAPGAVALALMQLEAQKPMR